MRAVAAAGALLLAGCAGELSTLDPAGPAAARVATLWWVMLGGAVVILTGVVGTALYALRRVARQRTFSEGRVLIGWGLVFPVVTLLALMAFAFLRGEQLLGRGDPADQPLRAHSQQWSWTFGYPGGEQTSQILHVPSGQEFTLAITSGDVIHSFWVPRLGGKMDAIPGKTNQLRLQADQPGIYRGVCAEYCGLGHAHMQFEVHAHLPEDYPAALASAAEVVADPLPVLEQRPAPVGTLIGRWADYLLDWLGVT
jgi:cytochrome c oxidase subunit 2